MKGVLIAPMIRLLAAMAASVSAIDGIDVLRWGVVNASCVRMRALDALALSTPPLRPMAKIQFWLWEKYLSAVLIHQSIKNTGDLHQV